MNNLQKLQENTMLSLQNKLVESNNDIQDKLLDKIYDIFEDFDHDHPIYKYKDCDAKIENDTLQLSYQTQQDIESYEVNLICNNIIPKIKQELKNYDNNITNINITFYDRSGRYEDFVNVVNNKLAESKETSKFVITYNDGAVQRRHVKNKKKTIVGTKEDVMEFLDSIYVDCTLDDDDEEIIPFDEWVSIYDDECDLGGSTAVIEITQDGKTLYQNNYMLECESKLQESVNSIDYIDQLNELKDMYIHEAYKAEKTDIKQNIIQILQDAPDGIEMYRVRKDSTSGWTSYGSYSEEKTVIDEYKKYNGVWTMVGDKRDIEDAFLSIVYNSGDLMTKEQAEKFKDEMSKDDKSYHRDIINTDVNE